MADEQVTKVVPVRLKLLLQKNHWQTHRTFCKQYDIAAASIDPALKGMWPSKAQLYRWLGGDLKGLPYPDHCRVLEGMFPGWTVEQLFERCDDEDEQVAVSVGAPSRAATPVEQTGHGVNRELDIPNPTCNLGYADVVAVFASRSEFSAAMSPYELFDDASDICMVGLSLNLLCQQYPDHRLGRLVEEGATVKCLFLDPEGRHIKEREREEGHPDGQLSMLTRLNIDVLSRLRERLSTEAQQRLEIGAYDETIRFNIILIDGVTGIVQPYMPDARGIDSPTLVLKKGAARAVLLPTFEHVFTSQWERRKRL